ncbi:phosphatidylinositol 3-kinase catalytic subunit type 3-like protein [Dinothrombium tinctorium]|uniref:Phosphatidylinositol 3-kinase catalytic subunit type 3 n=1 Tax=Dinothrombium tinctorium TaxID=1965070 RepID=A0A443RM10_9ACAR|nr:phosphatidylinositol 3-kinase catalytic subunit type 3-like protein [Dinothrombium tinctorium]
MANSSSLHSSSDKDCERFCFIYSCDIEDVNFKIKIGTLEGNRPEPDYKKLIENPLLKYSGLYSEGKAALIISCQLIGNEKLLCPSKQLAFKHFDTRWNWNEWMVFPIKFSDLPRNAALCFTIWDTYGPGNVVPVGGTAISIFSKYGAMRQGIHDLKIWSNHDGNFTETPAKSDKSNDCVKLNKLKKRYQQGHMMKIDWLDKLTFLEIERLAQEEKTNSNNMFLSIEFPKIIVDNIEHTIVYFEKGAEESCNLSFDSDIVIIPDPEMLLENLVESKHYKLSRSVRSGLTDRDLKPNAQVRDQLNLIVSYPPTKILTSEEQDLIWKFRFYLMSQKKALTKFLKCVNWDAAMEAKQAIDLLSNWQPMDVEDALELLSPQFQHPAVRKYAVSRLKQAPDEDLLLYLLQLVQALKYENFDEIKAGLDLSREKSGKLSAFPELEKDGMPSRRPSMMSEHSEALVNEIISDNQDHHMSESTLDAEDTCDLATFLINRACVNDTLSNYFFWYLIVECEQHNQQSEMSNTGSLTASLRDNKIKEMYASVMNRFSQKLMKGTKKMIQRRATLVRQKLFVERLLQVMKLVAREKGDRIKKIERLQALLCDTEIYNFRSFDPLPLPLDPEVKIAGIIPEKASIFKSALMPSRLPFLTVDNKIYVAILKHGDDMRQDQLILQTISLMDKLLRRENLDLKLTPYKVLATGSKHGLVQNIDSIPVAEVLKNYDGSIQKYFRLHNPMESSPYGISPDVMDTYVKSCAGYCIITYLLGVGDRHLDNLLLTKSGKLFHIDFGYILGRDPKPFPPPMKLSREMVEAMGGVNSEHYQQFKKLCYTAFLHLRRHANLILNLFNLMVDATIPDIALEPDKMVKKVQDKFRLDLTDEEAVHHIQSLIDVSVTAVMAALVEQIHKFAQYWRK